MLLGGELAIDAAPGAGTRVTISLPAPTTQEADAMTPIRVGIVDDHALVREGLRLILEAQPDMEVVGEASDPAGAISMASLRKPHIMLVDLTLDGADGVGLVRDLTRQFPQIRLIALTMHHDEETVRQAFLAGVAGYVVKGAASADLIVALRAVANNQHYVHPVVASVVVVDSLRWLRQCRSAEPARDRGPAPGHGRADGGRDRRRPRHQRPHGPAPPVEHGLQGRRPRPGRPDPIRRREPPAPRSLIAARRCRPPTTIGAMHDSGPLDPSLGQAPPVRARRLWRRVAAGSIVIVLVGVAAFVATRPLGSASSSPSPGPATAIGSIVEGVAVGQAPADFILPGSQEPLLVDLDGRPVRLADFAGRPLWIVFWATWCVPCQEEATDILAAFHAHRADGLAVLAIDIQEPTDTVRAYVQGHGLDYTVALDPTATVRARFGGVGLPAHVFLDRRGVIRDRYLGQMTAALMEQQLASIMAP